MKRTRMGRQKKKKKMERGTGQVIDLIPLRKIK